MSSTTELSAEEVEKVRGLIATLPDERSIYEAIGASLGPAASGEPPEERGRRAMARRLDEVRGYICGNAALRTFSTNDSASDMTELAITVAGVLVATRFAGLDPFLVACLVTRVGLRKICKQEWA